MEQALIDYLKKIRPQEATLIESGSPSLSYILENADSDAIEREISSVPRSAVDVLQMPRLVEVEAHSSEYLELIYVAAGSGRQVLDDSVTLELQTDDLLMLSPGTRHQIAKADRDDIALHFLVVPELLQKYRVFLKEDTVLRRFLTDIMNGDQCDPPYLHFHLQDLREARNLLENMVLAHLRGGSNCQMIIQATMGVLMLELSNKTYTITFGDPSDYEKRLVMQAMNYIEEDCAHASLEEFCALVSRPSYYISRLMKRYSAYTFTAYVQRKRLLQAAYLLMETKTSIEEIIVEVGYENSSYFHRIFREKYAMTPKEYRKKYSAYQEGK